MSLLLPLQHKVSQPLEVFSTWRTHSAKASPDPVWPLETMSPLELAKLSSPKHNAFSAATLTWKTAVLSAPGGKTKYWAVKQGRANRGRSDPREIQKGVSLHKARDDRQIIVNDSDEEGQRAGADELAPIPLRARKDAGVVDLESLLACGGTRGGLRVGEGGVVKWKAKRRWICELAGKVTGHTLLRRSCD